MHSNDMFTTFRHRKKSFCTNSTARRICGSYSRACSRGISKASCWSCSCGCYGPATLGYTFDLVFIDGDKREYPDYYRMLMGDGGSKVLVHSGSILIADNILWSGKIVEPVAHNDRHTQALLEFNRMIREDERVENVIVPIRDGLNLIRVK